VITPAGSTSDGPTTGTLRIALHSHFHYSELAAEFMRRLAATRSRCDLLLSTNSKHKAEALRRLTEDYNRGRVSIRIVPNRGRNLGPFLTALREEILADYDIIGHVHGKRSLYAGEVLGGYVARIHLAELASGAIFNVG
jgi:lipopolysaccharide biosynthesis protein